MTSANNVAPPHKPHGEFFVTISFFIAIFIYQTLRTIRRAIKFRQKHINDVLLLHIAVGVGEVIRYYARSIANWHNPAIASHVVHPDILDLTFTAITTISSVHLTRDKARRGDLSILRPAYHALTTCRVLFTLSAMAFQLPWLYHSSIKILVAFIYPRVTILSGAYFKLLPNYQQVYTAAMVMSSFLALHDSGIPFGPQLYLVIYIFYVSLHRWVGEKVNERKVHPHEAVKAGIGTNFMDRKLRTDQTPSVKDRLVNVLYQAGFVELDTLSSGRTVPVTPVKLPAF